MKHSQSVLPLRMLAILCCGTVLYFFANLHRVSMPGAVFDRLCELYGCKPAGVAGLGAVFMYAYALMQPFAGLLLERYGSGRVMISGVFAFAAGELLFATAECLPAAYCGQILAGMGVGSLYLTLLKDNLQLFPVKYNLILSSIILIGYAGGVCANAPFLMVVERLGLRQTLLLEAAGITVLWLICLVLILAGGLPSVAREHTFSPREYLPVFKKRNNIIVYVFAGLNFGLYYVLQTVIGKKFVQDYCQIPELTAGWILSATGGCAAAGGFLFALVGQFAGRRRYIFCRMAGVLSLTCFSIIFVLLVSGVRSGVLFAALLLGISSIASLTTVLTPILKDSNSYQLVNRCLSLLNFSCYIAVAALGNLTGLILNCFSPEKQGDINVYGRNAWLTIFGVMLCCSCIVCRLAFRICSRPYKGTP